MSFVRTACATASIVAIVALVNGSAMAQKGFYLKDGDRVVFYGDSITDQRLYTIFTESYIVTRFPKLNVKFIHSGWGGDRVGGGGGGPIDLRLKRDVFAYNPTVMTIMLGMNDGSYRPYDSNIFNTYSTGFQHIIDSMKSHSPGIRITLIQPSPFDDVTRAPGFEGGYNGVLIRYGSYLKDLALKEHLDVADLNTPVVASLERAKALDTTPPKDPKEMQLSQRLVPDRVHPGPAGHLLMAAALLKAWNAPAVVSAVELDAAAHRLVKAENAKVTGVVANGTGLAWMQTDNALPMPIDLNDAPTQLALRASDFVETLDQQTLHVAGLSGARYALKIDGQEVGAFTNEQFAQGINLAVLPTPMLKQALEVHFLTKTHNDLHFTRWRVIQVPRQNELTSPIQKTMDAMDKAEDDIVKQQHAAAMPRPHKFELVAQP